MKILNLVLMTLSLLDSNVLKFLILFVFCAGPHSMKRTDPFPILHRLILSQDPNAAIMVANNAIRLIPIGLTMAVNQCGI